MSTREAKLRITADGNSAEGTLSRLTKSAKGLGSGITGAISPLWQSAGAISGLGAGAGLVALTTQAIQTRSQFDKLQFSIKAGSGSLVDMSRLQGMAAASSDKWGYGMSKLSTTMQTLHDGSGDLEFVRDTLDAVAMASRASGEDLNEMGGLAGDLGEKFGISAVEMEDALATVLSMSHQGGLTFKDMGGAIGKLGASAKAAGLDGEQGLKRILGFANFASDALGSTEQAVEATNKLVAGMGTKDFQTKAMGLGVDVKASMKKGAGFEDILADIATKNSPEKLTQTFGAGPEGKLLVALSDVVRDAGGGEAGRKKLKESLDQLSRSAMSASTLQEMAAKNLKESPAAKFELAMAALEKAMMSDQVAGAIDKFAAQIPKLADGLAKLIPAAVEHPGAAAAGVGVLTGNPVLAAIGAWGEAYDQGQKLWEEQVTDPKVIGSGLPGRPEIVSGVSYDTSETNWSPDVDDAVDRAWALEQSGAKAGPMGTTYRFTDRGGTQRERSFSPETQPIVVGGSALDGASELNGIRGYSERLKAQQSFEAEQRLKTKLAGLNWQDRGYTMDGAGLNSEGKRKFLGEKPASSGGQQQNDTKALHDAIRASLDRDKGRVQLAKIDGEVSVKVINVAEFIPGGT